MIRDRHEELALSPCSQDRSKNSSVTRDSHGRQDIGIKNNDHAEAGKLV